MEHSIIYEDSKAPSAFCVIPRAFALTSYSFIWLLLDLVQEDTTESQDFMTAED